ncbi:MAG: hypothetical protein KAI57_02350 [Candidatus Pacebacteria bacterium]|nr:hypothetical protein [Candidatus Paceibacterota bacterium]
MCKGNATCNGRCGKGGTFLSSTIEKNGHEKKKAQINPINFQLVGEWACQMLKLLEKSNIEGSVICKKITGESINDSFEILIKQLREQELIGWSNIEGSSLYEHEIFITQKGICVLNQILESVDFKRRFIVLIVLLCNNGYLTGGYLEKGLMKLNCFESKMKVWNVLSMLRNNNFLTDNYEGYTNVEGSFCDLLTLTIEPGQDIIRFLMKTS